MLYNRFEMFEVIECFIPRNILQDSEIVKKQIKLKNKFFELALFSI